MTKELQTHTVYLIGIGGIGMSALARYFRKQGKEVSGYDRNPGPLTWQLEAEGIPVHYTDDPAYIPCDAGLVIYTPAIPDDNKELRYCREAGMCIRKRAEVLGMIASEYRCIAVGGTHGKTSISSMIAHIFKHSDHPVTALIGGVMSNYGTNMLIDKQSTYLVAEADEYDRSFLQLKPYLAVVSALAADHLDIYGSEEEMNTSFSDFIGQTHPEGSVLLHESIAGKLKTPENTEYYGKQNNAFVRIASVDIREHQFVARLISSDADMEIRMGVPGMHNVENAAAAVAVCLKCGIASKEIIAGLESYRGVKRRYEILLEGERTYIDDYAHHPEEITACINTTKSLYPERRLTGIFQPHLYSRTRDLADAFARALEALDEVILLEIYPAREKPIKGVDSRMLLDKIKLKEKTICSKEELPEMIRRKKPELLLSMGAGDIDRLVDAIKKSMMK